LKHLISLPVISEVGDLDLSNEDLSSIKIPYPLMTRVFGLQIQQRLSCSDLN
jgi:hypothetical protein